MKKFLKYVTLILMIISILINCLFITPEIVKIIRIMFFGMTFGSNEYPTSLWWGEVTLKGLTGIKIYYKAEGVIFIFYELPIIVINLLYQFIYFKIIRKNL